MNFEQLILKRKLKKEHSYLSIQQDLARYRELGIEKYTFLGNGCDRCASLNKKTFLVDEAEVGVNLPPMHPGCKCTIAAKSKMDLFKERNELSSLKNNPKFEEWIRKQ